MARLFRFDPSVVDDVESIIQTYDTISPNLGSRFRRSIKKLLSMIRHNPEMYAVTFDRYRCAMVRKFPYIVTYSVTDAATTILPSRTQPMIRIGCDDAS